MDTKLQDFKKRRRKARHKKAMGKCNNKVKHDDQSAAKQAIAVMIKRSIKRGKPIVSYMNAYQCEHCGKWHVGRNKRAINWDLVAQL